MALPRLERPFERGESGSKSYLDHEATTSISGGSSQLLSKRKTLLWERRKGVFSPT